jgi:hypothetical protein
MGSNTEKEMCLLRQLSLLLRAERGEPSALVQIVGNQQSVSRLDSRSYRVMHVILGRCGWYNDVAEEDSTAPHSGE